MEMEFKDPGRRRRLMVVMIGGILAAAAGLGAFTLASQGSGGAPVPQTQILVAAHEIAARTAVGSDDVMMRSVPVDQALNEAYATEDDVVGRITSVPIYADQQITPNLFATSNADADFSILGPDELVTADSPDWRAVALNIPPERAVGGELKAGQHVDVVVSVTIQVMTQDENGNYVAADGANAQGIASGVSTKITFQDVEVLKSTPDTNLYVLKVDLHQAEQLAHVVGENPNAVALVLRPDEDTRTADTSQYGTTDDRLIMTYLYPAPQLLDLSQLLNPPVPVGQPGSSPVPGGTSTASPTPGPDASATPGPDESAAPDASESPAATPET